MKKPEKLKKGDKIALVCPASQLRTNLKTAKKVFERWGLEVILGKTIHSNFGTFSGNDEERRQDLQFFLDDPQIKAVFAARGGYGTVRIIDRLNFDVFLKNPKWLIGFSDITVLHSHLHRVFDICSIHGQMPGAFDDSSGAALDSLHTSLFGHDLHYQYSSFSTYNRSGNVSGIIIGGNLAILHSLIASESDMDYSNKILFIEDVGEKVYNIDRMMWTLKRAGKLDRLKGLLVGGFTDLKISEPAFNMDYQEVIYEKIQEYKYPVAFDFPAGHIADNRAIIHGSMVDLSVVDHNISLTFKQ